ncbi:hypothetical protein Tco_0355920 [Tanacetum coccineum]
MALVSCCSRERSHRVQVEEDGTLMVEAVYVWWRGAVSLLVSLIENFVVESWGRECVGEGDVEWFDTVVMRFMWYELELIGRQEGGCDRVYRLEGIREISHSRVGTGQGVEVKRMSRAVVEDSLDVGERYIVRVVELLGGIVPGEQGSVVGVDLFWFG